VFEFCLLGGAESTLYRSFLLLLSGNLSLLEGGALGVGNAGNADEGSVLEVGAVGGELGAGDCERALVVETKGGSGGGLDGGVALRLVDSEELSLLLAAADLDSNSSVVSESGELVAVNVEQVVRLGSEGNSEIAASSAREAGVLASHLPDEIGGGKRQSSAFVVNLSSHVLKF